MDVVLYYYLNERGTTTGEVRTSVRDAVLASERAERTAPEKVEVAVVRARYCAIRRSHAACAASMSRCRCAATGPPAPSMASEMEERGGGGGLPLSS